MTTKAQMTGMCGVYLVAAELSRLGFIVSPTSRSARGADLLVTDKKCGKAWSIQVKTNGKPASNWLLNARARTLISDSFVNVFVNLRRNERPDFVVALSAHVAAHMKEKIRKTGSTWYWFERKARPSQGEGWELFGSPHTDTETESDDENLDNMISA